MLKFRTILPLLCLCILPAFGWVGVPEERTEKPNKVEGNRAVYAVYGVTAQDYLPDTEGSAGEGAAYSRPARRSRSNLMLDVPSGFYFAMVPIFIGLLFMVLYLFVHDIEREDKVIVERDMGSMDP